MNGLSSLFVTLPLIVITYESLAHADNLTQRMTINFSKGTTLFVSLGDDGELVSENCGRIGQQCLALDVLKKVTFKKLEYLRRNPAINLGAAICTQMKGVVSLGQDDWKRDRSFCLFDDGSLIENSTLFERAQKNDRKNSP